MRQAFIIGAIFLWVAINILGGLSEQQTLLGQTDPDVVGKDGQPLTQYETLGELQEPEITDWNVVTMFVKVGKFLVLVGKAITLWHPALWQGSALYIYAFLIAPIGISFWVIFVMALRGIGSS
jgi:hypothetical protein